MRIHSIEFTNECNLKCGYCANKDSTYPKGFLSFDTFKEALKHSIPGVGLSGCGESLLHPDWLAFVGYALDNGKKPGLNTNGLLLTEEHMYKLIDMGMTQMEISIHTEKSYQAYKMACLVNKECGNRMSITANLLSVNHEKAIKWRGVDTYPMRVQHTHQWALKGEHPTSCEFIKADFCQMKWDGTIVACCYDFNGDAVIGHLQDFETLKHRRDYRLCATCSPSWVNGKHTECWYV